MGGGGVTEGVQDRHSHKLIHSHQMTYMYTVYMKTDYIVTENDNTIFNEQFIESLPAVYSMCVFREAMNGKTP